MTNEDLRRSTVRAGEALHPGLGLDAFADAVCARHEAWCAELGWLEKSPNAHANNTEQQ